MYPTLSRVKQQESPSITSEKNIDEPRRSLSEKSANELAAWVEQASDRPRAEGFRHSIVDALRHEGRELSYAQDLWFEDLDSMPEQAMHEVAALLSAADGPLEALALHGRSPSIPAWVASLTGLTTLVLTDFACDHVDATCCAGLSHIEIERSSHSRLSVRVPAGCRVQPVDVRGVRIDVQHGDRTARLPYHDNGSRLDLNGAVTVDGLQLVCRHIATSLLVAWAGHCLAKREGTGSKWSYDAYGNDMGLRASVSPEVMAAGRTITGSLLTNADEVYAVHDGSFGAFVDRQASAMRAQGQEERYCALVTGSHQMALRVRDLGDATHVTFADPGNTDNDYNLRFESFTGRTWTGLMEENLPGSSEQYFCDSSSCFGEAPAVVCVGVYQTAEALLSGHLLPPRPRSVSMEFMPHDASRWHPGVVSLLLGNCGDGDAAAALSDHLRTLSGADRAELMTERIWLLSKAMEHGYSAVCSTYLKDLSALSRSGLVSAAKVKKIFDVIQVWGGLRFALLSGNHACVETLVQHACAFFRADVLRQRDLKDLFLSRNEDQQPVHQACLEKGLADSFILYSDTVLSLWRSKCFNAKTMVALMKVDGGALSRRMLGVYAEQLKKLHLAGALPAESAMSLWLDALGPFSLVEQDGDALERITSRLASLAEFGQTARELKWRRRDGALGRRIEETLLAFVKDGPDDYLDALLSGKTTELVAYAGALAAMHEAELLPSWAVQNVFPSACEVDGLSRIKPLCLGSLAAHELAHASLRRHGLLDPQAIRIVI